MALAKVRLAARSLSSRAASGLRHPPREGRRGPGSLAWAMADNSGVRGPLRLAPDLRPRARRRRRARGDRLHAASSTTPSDSLAVALNLLMTAPLAARRAAPPARRGDGDRQHAVPAGLTAPADRGRLRRRGLDALSRRRAAPAPRGLGTARLVFLLNGIAPLGGGLESAILLVVAVFGARPRQLAAADARARRGARRAGGHGRARPHRARAARRGRPPHLDDRRRRPTPPGWPRPACRPRPASGTCSPIRATARDRDGRDAARARRAARRRRRRGRARSRNPASTG